MFSYYARRLGAFFYDGLLLLAFWLLATFLLVIFSGQAAITPHTGTLSRLPFWLFLLLIAWAFFGWFWTHGGQTLGMRAWKLRVRKESNGKDTSGTQATPERLNWPDANRRFAAALLVWIGAGALAIPLTWWITNQVSHSERITALLGAWIAVGLCASLLPYRGKSIVDRLSGTRVVVLG
jgi:uncharacterized RDD family membrane protein YckC